MNTRAAKSLSLLAFSLALSGCFNSWQTDVASQKSTFLSTATAAPATAAPATAVPATAAPATVAPTTAAPTQVSQTTSLDAGSQSLPPQFNSAIATLSPSLSSISFAHVALNTATSYPVTLTSTGTAPVTINGATVTGAGFSVTNPSLPLTLNPDQSVAMAVQFSPGSAGSVSGQLAITSTSSTNPTVVIGLIGTVESLPLAFTGVSCSNTSAVVAGADPCTSSSNGASAGSGVTGSMSSGDPVATVPVQPTVPSNAATAESVADSTSAGSVQTSTSPVNLGGDTTSSVSQTSAAISRLAVDMSSVPFGNVGVNSTATQYVTLTSAGDLPVTINSAALTGAGFNLAGNTLPVTLNPNQALTLTLQFAPAVAGSASGQLTITSTSSTNPTQVVDLSGSGVQHEVDLSWEAPPSSPDPVVGYKVYRSPGAASSYQLASSQVVTTTGFNDLNVQSGFSYDYTVTSVDAAGGESVPSNIATVTIP